jgi:hypothetical protein
VVVTRADLVAAVDAAFVDTSAGLSTWPDPHPERMPSDEEYSRVTDARDGASSALARTHGSVRSSNSGSGAPSTTPRSRGAAREVPAHSCVRIVPHAAGALPLVICRSGLGDVVDAGVVLGAGDPAVCVSWFPDCGCDACDSGSADELQRSTSTSTPS